MKDETAPNTACTPDIPQDADGRPGWRALTFDATHYERMIEDLDLSEDAKHELLGVMWNIIVSFCLLYTSPSPRDRQKSRMPSSA